MNWDKRGHDATTFPKMTRNDNYFPWKETFTQLLKNEIMLFFTDPDPIYDYKDIIDEHDIKLYERKITFFGLVLLHTIQNYTVKAILNKFRSDEPDARAAFLAIDERIRNGLVQIYSVSTALAELDSLNIQTFNGTQTAFLTTWFEKLREYNLTGDERNLMSFAIARAKLNQAIQADPDLLRVFDELEVSDD